MGHAGAILPPISPVFSPPYIGREFLMPTSIIKGIIQDLGARAGGKPPTAKMIAAAQDLGRRASEIERKEEERRIRRTCTPSDQDLLKRIAAGKGKDAFIAKKILEKGETITDSDRQFIENKK